MQHEIIGGEAFGPPYPEERVGAQKIAVQPKGQRLSLGTVICLYVFRQPGFDPAPFVVVGPAAFDGKILSGFKSIDQEIPDIVAAFLKGFDKFLIF